MLVDVQLRRNQVWQRLTEQWAQTSGQGDAAGDPPDGFVVSNLINVRYLTGFCGSNGVLLLTADTATLGTDSRYVTQAGQECPDLQMLIQRATLPAVVEEAAKQGVRRLAFESATVTFAEHAALQAIDGAPGLVPVAGVVEALRVTKDDDEIAQIRAACRISDAALSALLPQIHPGLSERQIARRLEWQLYEHGADGLSFETIVAAGENAAIPHHVPSERRLRAGDLLKIDFGAEYRGYHADETRTFVVGAPPASWQRELHSLVLTAQAAGRDAARPGAALKDVDEASRSVITTAGHGDHFGHGLGHGVGLEIHEAPMISHGSTGLLSEGATITIEPGVYLPGRGGIRIEDTLLVSDGAAEPLTLTTRNLLVLD